MRRVWPFLLLAAIVFAAFGGGASVLLKSPYQATATAFVATDSTGSLAELTSGAGYAQEAAAQYATLATTSYVLRPVIARLQLDATPAELASTVTATSVSGQAVIQIAATAKTADAAAQIANAVAASLADSVGELAPATTTGSSGAHVRLTLVDPAVPPTTSTGPKPLLLIVGGGLVGAVLALLVALFRVVLDTRIRNEEGLARVTDLPLLGTTIRDRATKQRPLAVVSDGSGTRAEAFRTLRTNLRFVELEPHARSIVVTSSVASEGKSTVSANLALAEAALGARVLLVDADLRRPAVASMFDIDGSVGLTDVLIGGVPLEQAIQRGAGGLDLLPAGIRPPNPNEQLQSRAMGELIGRLHSDYDLVVFDSPPLLAVSDATALSTAVGVTLVVCAADRVRRGELDAALGALQLAEARVAGLVLTMLPKREAGPDRYGYGDQRRTGHPHGTLGRSSELGGAW